MSNKYGILKTDIHTWDVKSKRWITIPKGTKGIIRSSFLVPLSMTFELLFEFSLNNGDKYRAIECANKSILKLCAE